MVLHFFLYFCCFFLQMAFILTKLICYNLKIGFTHNNFGLNFFVRTNLLLLSSYEGKLISCSFYGYL
jgi:hypothetical protein